MSSTRHYSREILQQLSRIAQALEQGVMTPPSDWNASTAFRLHHRAGQLRLEPVKIIESLDPAVLKNIAIQLDKVDQNTRQFVKGLPANNVLLTGARGTGKSSLVRAMLSRYASKGLRLIELDKTDLLFLQDVVNLISGRSERFILFCDDLSFEEGEQGYKALKSVLDGSIAGTSDNVLIYATSNRRHLLPQVMKDNLQTQHMDNGEIRPAEAIEEKVSLSDRFGIWVSFHAFNQDEYLMAVQAWLGYFNMPYTHEARHIALRWTIERGHRSGRLAYQFAKYWAGSQSL
jgi:predicted AAA+ superfamily ATPase